MTGMAAPNGRRRLVPAFLATDGSAWASRNTLDRMTVLTATGDRVPEGLDPPAHRIVTLLSGGALTLAEVAAYLRLPVSVVKVLVSELVDHGRLTVHAPLSRSGHRDRQLLERVLSGLRARL
jgi:hypothetical protein